MSKGCKTRKKGGGSKPRNPSHEDNLHRLARIEGQIRGIRRMIENGAYCMDIARQIQAVRAALQAVGHRILRKHMATCLAEAARSASRRAWDQKLSEIMTLLDESGK